MKYKIKSKKRIESNLTLGYSEKELKDVFFKHQDNENWKKPFTSYTTSKEEADKLGKAIIFYHATKPEITTTTLLMYPHKDALVKLPTKIYVIKSDGYKG